MGRKLHLFARMGVMILTGLWACGKDSGHPSPREDGAEDAFLIDGKTSIPGMVEGSAEACGILSVVNDSTVDQLKSEVGLSALAAARIAAYRVGEDGKAGTFDDGYFDSLGELDEVKYVGPIAFSKLADHSKKKNKTCKLVDLQLLSISDLHGQLEPTTVSNLGQVGGVAALDHYFSSHRMDNPRTLLLSAGDSFGGSPPIAAFFDEVPVIEAMNLMGFDAESPGNHSFDRGISHLQGLIELSNFPLVAANLTGVEQTMTCGSKAGKLCISPYQHFWVGGVKVAVIGLLTPEAPSLVKPGMFGSIEVTDPLLAARASRAKAASEGAKVFIALAHIGGHSGDEGQPPTGPLVELAGQLDGFDLLIGGHTHTTIEATVGGLLVLENPNQGAKYSCATLTFDFEQGKVVNRSGEMIVPVVEGIDADPVFDELLDPYRSQVEQQLDQTVGVVQKRLERGSKAERLREVGLGNLLADALRFRYRSDLAVVNGGGLRASMPSSHAPANLLLRRPSPEYQPGPPYDVVLGDIFALLPFVNDAAIATVTGEQVWAMMEHGLGFLPAPHGGFPQISGIEVTFDSSAPSGSRVRSIVLGHRKPIEKDGTRYSLVTNDFMFLGGDGYSMFVGVDGQIGERLTDILREYIEGKGTVDSEETGRLVDIAAR